MKKKTIKQLKKIADTLWSEYIRKRDCTICYTCNTPLPYNKSQCGHFISRDCLQLRYDEANCHCQCLTEESSLRLFNGKNKSIKHIKAGDKLWGFDDKTFEKSICVVEKTSNFTPEELYEVELENGKKFYATGDHKIVANGKWIKIEDILHSYATYDIMEL